LCQVELDITHFDTSPLRVVEDLMVEMRVVEESFRRNAADVQACSSKGATFFDTGYLFCTLDMRKEAPSSLLGSYFHAFLASFDGRNIASNTASYDDQILFFYCSSASGESTCSYARLTSFSGITSFQQSRNGRRGDNCRKSTKIAVSSRILEASNN